MAEKNPGLPAALSTEREISDFLAQVAQVAAAPAGATRGRLIFALDATASRQPTWDRAAALQGEMFLAAASLGGLEIQPCFYRGFGEFKAGPWFRESGALLRLMSTVTCRAGHTQIAKVLQHAINMTRQQRVAALVFVGDCCEEDVDGLCALAGQLGLLGTRAFVFHEGSNAVAASAMREIARLANGVYCRFDSGSANALRDLLRAVAAYAAGGLPALQAMQSQSEHVKLITRQLLGH